MSHYHIVPPTVGGQAIEDACSGLEVACVLTHNQDSSWFMLETSSDVALADILPGAVLALGAYPAYVTDNCVAPCDLTHEEAVAIVGRHGASGEAWRPAARMEDGYVAPTPEEPATVPPFVLNL